MSYLSASGNLGYGTLSQISESSCASQYKMCAEGAGGAAGGDGDEELPYASEHLFSSKYKLDPDELYTFHDTDGVAGEITVEDHTDTKPLSPPLLHNDIDDRSVKLNGLVDDFTDRPHMILPNGHYSETKSRAGKKNTTTKSIRSPSRACEDLSRSNSISEILASVGQRSPSLVGGLHSPSADKSSIISVSNEKPFSTTSCSQSFLDVFKREMGSFGKLTSTKDVDRALPVTCKPDVKNAHPRKLTSGKGSGGGRGPAQHEALQRIPPPSAPAAAPTTSAVATTSRTPWHAPGPYDHECAPLTDKKHRDSLPRDSSDDDADMPSFGSWVLTSADDAEAGGGDARGARLAARRATLRRQVAHAAAALRLAPGHRRHAALAHTLNRHLTAQKSTAARLPSPLLSQLLASRGASAVLSTKERRKLRSSGWSGGAGSGSGEAEACAAEGCRAAPLPCARHCLAHVTLAPEQRLYAPCAAVFAGGARCRQPLLHLDDQTPLCAEHAWKRDNYDKISRETRDCKPKKVAPRKRPSAAAARRPARRRRPAPPRAAPPPPPPPPVHRAPTPPHTQPHRELNVCSNSSTYDSSEDTGIGGLSDTEFITAAASDHTSLEVGEVEEVQAPDDILDAAVLHQIPDEAFTEFFNQTEGAEVGGRGGFAESEELARALEAVLDERALDSLADCVFTHAASHHVLHTPHQSSKMAASSLGVEMSSSATS